MRLVFDLDGFFFNFHEAFVEVAERETGVRIELPNGLPTHWDFDKDSLTPEQHAKVWTAIGRSHNFWMKLKPINESLIRKVASVQALHDIYFLTNRVGPTAKFQSEASLLQWFQLPTVLIARDKAPILKALQADIFVDDNTENCEAAHAARPEALVLMPELPYNREVEGVLRTKEIERALGAILWPHEMKAAA